ncbi:MAG: thioredoxin fold domain-containing protein [bacterium]|nr:thioredoxin fold domain-containing protein [bacterium]
MISKIFKLAFIILVWGQLTLVAGVTWKTDWQKELKDAAANNRPVLLDFYTDWCPHCKRLDKTTFVDKSVAEFFKKENYVLIKINPEKDRAAEDKFKVYSYPTLVMFNGKGNEIDRILGYRDAKQLVQALSDLKKGIGTLGDLLNRYEKTKGQATEKNFKLISEIMSKYTARADYPEALGMADETIRLDQGDKLKKAADALSYKGYIYYKWKKYQKAIDVLLSVHKIYPESEHGPGGFVGAAYYSQKLEDPALTANILKTFLEKYPDHNYAKRAREKLEKIEKHLAQKK